MSHIRTHVTRYCIKINHELMYVLLQQTKP